LKFARIFDQHDPIGGLGHLGQKRVGQRCLAGRRAASDEYVLTPSDRIPQDSGLLQGHDSRGDIVVESEYGDRGLADCEGRSCYDGRQETFETLSGPG
jgi:hypothetical protein